MRLNILMPFLFMGLAVLGLVLAPVVMDTAADATAGDARCFAGASELGRLVPVLWYGLVALAVAAGIGTAAVSVRNKSSGLAIVGAVGILAMLLFVMGPVGTVHAGSACLQADGSVQATGDLNMGGNDIRSLASLAFGDGSTQSTGAATPATVVVCAADSDKRGRCDYVGSGNHHETVINNAIDDACVAGGGLVHLVQGTYNMTETQTSTLPIIDCDNVVIEGDGPGTNVIMVTDANADRYAFTFKGAADNDLTGVGIRNLRITGQYDSHHGIKMEGVGEGFVDGIYCVHNNTEPAGDECLQISGGTFANTNIRVMNSYIASWNHGMEIAGKSWYITVDNVQSANNAGRGLSIRSTDAANPPEHITVSNFVAVNNTGDGVQVANGKHIVLSGIIARLNKDSGININASASTDVEYITIANCESTRNNDAGIRITNGKGHTVMGCDLFDNGQDTGATAKFRAGMYLSTTNAVIDGNRLYETRSGTNRRQQYGIYEETGSTSNLYNSNWMNNNVIDSDSMNGTSQVLGTNSPTITVP